MAKGIHARIHAAVSARGSKVTSKTAGQAAIAILGAGLVSATQRGRDCYFPPTTTVCLTRKTFDGTDIDSHMVAMHEVAHALQHRFSPRKFWWSQWWPLRLWLELDAWKNAASMVIDSNLFPAIEVKHAQDRMWRQWRTYLLPWK